MKTLILLGYPNKMGRLTLSELSNIPSLFVDPDLELEIFLEKKVPTK